MRCSSCEFENIPGSESCGRCGSSLRVATMVMDVQPPRASKFRKKLRRVMPMQRAMYGMRDSMENSRATKTAAAVRRASADLCGERPPWPVLWRLLVPGWSHFYAGQRVRGHLYLWGFLIFLIPGLLLMGSTWGSMLLGLAFSVHASAAFDVFNQASPRASIREMIARSILISILVAMVIYLPANWLLSRVAGVRTIQITTAPFREGDVVVINPSLHRSGWPHPGQVVLYNLPAVRTEAIPREIHGTAIYEYAGERIDRVLAIAGDKVVWEAGTLKVNGSPSPWRPLNVSALPAKVELTVPPDHVLIFPSTTPRLEGATRLNHLHTLSLVPRGQVIGTVYLRTQPLWRFGRVH